jgi:hypothetical protein
MGTLLSANPSALIVQWENIRLKFVECVFDSHSGQIFFFVLKRLDQYVYHVCAMWL